MQYIDLSDELIKHSNTSQLKEAYLRSAISRSYYGVFCLARNFLIFTKGITIPPVDTHKFVREQYLKSSNIIEKKIGESMKALLHERKIADYDNNATMHFKRAETAVELSKRILKQLKQIGTA